MKRWLKWWPAWVLGGATGYVMGLLTGALGLTWWIAAAMSLVNGMAIAATSERID